MKTIVQQNLALLIVSMISISSMVSADTDEMNKTDYEIAIFAGGCFWCMEPPFDKLEGVQSTISGYIGGHVDNPTYEQVSGGKTGHAEVVKVEFDPKKVSYQQLLDVFWKNIDPTVKDQQFCDHGTQYRSAIFPQSDSQAKLAEASTQALAASGRFKTIHTTIERAETFYDAEEYHQDYYIRNSARYKYYRWSCGRDARLRTLWGE